MKTIALVSGGKDSILAMLMAYRYGHEPAVIVNMTPVLDSDGASGSMAENGAQGHDIDSYMYQTVGFEAVEAMAACLGLPLRRGCVRPGRAKDMSLLYSDQPPEEDEVESLYALIKTVKAEFPEVEGLTSGAILSNYQRNRVECICDRLGLVSLSYLWMRQPGEILDMVRELHVRAILVKTASIGLVPRQLIGKTLEEVRPTLEKMAALYKSHLAGEGGEYETTVLDCPLFLSEHLRVRSLNLVMHDANDISPTGHGLLTFERVTKSAEQQTQAAELLGRLRAGDITFPSDVMPLLRRLCVSPLTPSATVPVCSFGETIASTLPGTISTALFLESGSAAARDGMVHHTYTDPCDAGGTAAEALRGCLAALQTWATEHDLTIFYYHVSLPESSWEVLCRAAYSAEVSHVCPPGLIVTVPAACSQAAAALQAEVLAAPTEKIQQQVLHAQSRSCWALGEPGPYSQARCVCLGNGASRLFVSATPGRVAVTREVATLADLPPPCRESIGAMVGAQYGEEIRKAVADIIAQFLVAISNCERYLTVFGRVFGDVSRATVIVTEEVPVAVLPALWQWSTRNTGALPFERVCEVVVVSALSGTEKIRVSMECAETREAEDENA
ncbi:hypothetical protein LSCM1_05225 [Leishmania martiniquensis]|uniref:Diphthine--ammonia ligase n=1 Tax=Leishmania martiniquensis TaxID=1580590 RepID=A0A836HHL6_9TRYP|nr:hypothetical protein LSCM1_05225 [Leishmania martiniquensis]